MQKYKYLLILTTFFSLPLFAETNIFADLEKDIQLQVGFDAPKLSDVFWLNQEPTDLFKDAEKIYFIEFWGTWCGPCVAAIPHLNEIARKYSGKVQVVGIAAREQGGHRGERLDAIYSFLNDPKSPIQDYPIAYGSPSVRQRWLTASRARGIPRTYLVMGGKIVWEGHPMESGRVLEQIFEGTWDIEAARKSSLGEKVADVAYKRLAVALESKASLQQRLKWVQECLSQFENNWDVRIKELELLAQLGGKHQKELNKRSQALLESNDLSVIFLALYKYNQNEFLRPLLGITVDHAVRLAQADNEEARRIAKYAQYFFKNLVDVLIQFKRYDDAQIFTDRALTAILNSEEKDPKMEAEWQEEAWALKIAKISCQDGICETPELINSCDQALNSSIKSPGP